MICSLVEDTDQRPHQQNLLSLSLTYPFDSLSLLFQATSHNSSIVRHIDIDRVGIQSSSASCAMPNKAETVVHDCWLLRSICMFFFYYPRYQCRLIAHSCGCNIPFQPMVGENLRNCCGDRLAFNPSGSSDIPTRFMQSGKEVRKKKCLNIS